MEEEINLELDITTLHIGQLIQVKETKEIVKITVIDSITNTVLTNPNTPYTALKDFQEVKPEEAYWLIETRKDGSKKEYGYHPTAKVRIDDTREYCKKMMNENLDIIRVDIINFYNDINYIERKQN